MHPRAYGADESFPIISAVSVGSSPYTRGGYLEYIVTMNTYRFIPVRTGRIEKLKSLKRMDSVHPRTHGADTKFLKKISMIDKSLTPSISNFCNRTSMCYFGWMHFCGYTFWSILIQKNAYLLRLLRSISKFSSYSRDPAPVMTVFVHCRIQI